MDALDGTIGPFQTLSTPASLQSFHSDLLESAQLTREALAALVEPGAPEAGAARALQAMHQHAQAQARLYPLRTVLPPVSGVLHPMNFSSGNLERVTGRPIFLVHGALDWMFPVALARDAARVLGEAGADLTFREIEDLSHTYPREMNAEILEGMGPQSSR